MPSPTTVLVTGATGWLGGHILTALRDTPGVVTVAAARDAARLPSWFDGEVRLGDLTDAGYRADAVRGMDVVIHAGTWSSFWGHERAEKELFLEPSIDLIDQAVAAGVRTFVSASTVALGTPAAGDALVPNDDAPVRRGYWPHLDRMIDIEEHMAARGGDGPASTRMVSLRLGHFVGAGVSLGLVPVIIPRLRTRQVPWVDGGRSHLPLVSGEDMGRAFALAATATDLAPYEPISIVGAEQPTAREVFTFVADTAGVPKPMYSVPTGAAFGFGSLMERLHPVLPGKAPFLTRALVHVGLNWHMDTTKARDVLGFEPQVHWRDAARASIEERRAGGFAWPALAQVVTPPASCPAHAAVPA